MAELEIDLLLAYTRNLAEALHRSDKPMEDYLQSLCKAVMSNWAQLYEFSNSRYLTLAGSFIVQEDAELGHLSRDSNRSVDIGGSEMIKDLISRLMRGRSIELKPIESDLILNEFPCPVSRQAFIELRPIPSSRSGFEDISEPLGLLVVAWDRDLSAIDDMERSMLKYALRISGSVLHTFLEKKRLEGALMMYSELSWLMSTERAQKLLMDGRYFEFSMLLEMAFSRSIGEHNLHLMCMSLQTLHRILKENSWADEVERQKVLCKNITYAHRFLDDMRMRLRGQVEVIRRLTDASVESLRQQSKESTGAERKNAETIVHYSRQCSLDLLSEFEILEKEELWGQYDAVPEKYYSISKSKGDKFSKIIKDLRYALLKINAACVNDTISDGTLSYQLHRQLSEESSMA